MSPWVFSWMNGVVLSVRMSAGNGEVAISPFADRRRRDGAADGDEAVEGMR